MTMALGRRRWWRPWEDDEAASPDEAKQAVEQARADLYTTKALDADIDRLDRALDRAARRNHFSEAMEALAIELSKKRRA